MFDVYIALGNLEGVTVNIQFYTKSTPRLKFFFFFLCNMIILDYLSMPILIFDSSIYYLLKNLAFISLERFLHYL